MSAGGKYVYNFRGRFVGINLDVISESGWISLLTETGNVIHCRAEDCLQLDLKPAWWPNNVSLAVRPGDMNGKPAYTGLTKEAFFDEYKTDRF